MKLTHVTLTGVDDHTDWNRLESLSQTHPVVEWGVLFSKKQQGKGRYAISGLLKQILKSRKTIPADGEIRWAAHLCGATMREIVKTHSQDTFDAFDPDAPLEPFGLTGGTFNRIFGRVQMNFDASVENMTKERFGTLIRSWAECFDSALITQHNTSNANLWAWGVAAQQNWNTLRVHQILHDASKGNGILAEHWNRPVAGVLNGYAGGLSAENVVETLKRHQDTIGNGAIWIDMESSLRDDQDRFSLDKSEKVLEAVQKAGETEGWFL